MYDYFFLDSNSVFLGGVRCDIIAKLYLQSYDYFSSYDIKRSFYYLKKEKKRKEKSKPPQLRLFPFCWCGFGLIFYVVCHVFGKGDQ